MCRLSTALVAAGLLALMGCSADRGSEEGQGCALLDPATVEEASGLNGISTTHLTASGEPGRRCAYVFTLPGGDGVLAVSELSGGVERYRAVRRAKVQELGSGAVRDVAGLGDQAFSAGARYLAVRSGGRVHTLESLFGAAQTLSLRQLRAFAQQILRRD
jgi:hypothetical protein